jgi:hypothetical protein
MVNSRAFAAYIEYKLIFPENKFLIIYVDQTNVFITKKRFDCFCPVSFNFASFGLIVYLFIH